MPRHHLSLALLALAGVAAARADTPADFLSRYASEARQAAPDFSPSAQRGERFFKTVGSRDWSCSTCHTGNPAASGRHATTRKPIEPLAPAANGARFTRADKVEKWFRRNCNDVVGRPCSAAEKSDLLAYLISVGQ